ncbi:MAG TPA: RIP metalloprotease RseP [Limnochordia bacterium]|nr:RIP metalloprotease RseP [Limnochordia bacterium]
MTFLQMVDTSWLSGALLTAVSFIVIFGTIVLFHELGHFAAAKAFGVRVFEFSVGIGPPLATLRRRETQYSIRMLPLGGFVKLAGMDPALHDEDEVAEDDARNFNSRPLWQRMLIIAAGPFMNFLLAFLLIAGYYMTVHVPPTVTRVTLNSPAHTAGLMPGDVIVAVDGQRTETAEDVIRIVQPNAGNPLTLSVRREKELIQLVVTPRLDPSAGVGLLGIEIRSQPRLGFVTSVVRAAEDTWRGTVGIVQAIGQMVTGRSEVDLRGPIGIITITGQAARQGIDALITLAIGLNLNLGLLNLLPIPVLDGGWLVLLAVEGLRGKPLEPEHRGIAQFVGLLIIVLLMIFAFYQDVLHLT